MLRNHIYNIRNKKLKELGYNSYQDYLLSDEWKEIKTKIRARKGKKWKLCNICGGEKYLDVHHSTYEVIGNPNPGNSVKVLCRGCHNDLHQLSREEPNIDFYDLHRKLKKRRLQLGLSIWK